MAANAQLTDASIQPDMLLKDFLAGLSEEGAVVSFCGIARPRSKSGALLERLRLDHHPTMTIRSLERIAADGARRFNISDCIVVHRHGLIAPNEVIVFAAAASLQRRAAFLCADYLMDRLKTDAIFWKKEEGAGGGRWIEPTDADRADATRWRD